MSLIARYIGKTVLLNTLLVLLVLVALTGIFAFIGELDDVGKGSYGLSSAMIYVLLRMPGSAYELFPPAVLLGSLLGLGALATHSEITVMRSAGISIPQIARSVALIGLILMLLVVLIGEFLMPDAERQAHEIRTAALTDRVSLSSRTGYWAKSGPLFVNIKSVLPDTTLVDISVYDFRKGLLKSVVRADKARQQGDGHWRLEVVRRTHFNETSLNTESAETEIWPNLVNAELLKGLSVPAESMSVANLFNQIRYLKRNQLDSRFTELALWTKITNPLSTMIMLMLSLPFVFASQRSGGVGQKMFVGILLGIGYFLLNRLVTHVGLANGLSPAISTMIPLLLFSAIAMIGLRRVT